MELNKLKELFYKEFDHQGMMAYQYENGKNTFWKSDAVWQWITDVLIPDVTKNKTEPMDWTERNKKIGEEMNKIDLKKILREIDEEKGVSK